MGATHDPAAYAEFVTARWQALFRTAYLLTGSDADAEDLLQNALVKAYLAWDRVTAADSPEAYVRRIVLNTFVSGKRRAWGRETSMAMLPERADPSADPDDRLGLWPRVLALPPRQRAVVVLRYYEDLTLQQTADVLGCSIGTAKSQASDALRTLRVALSPEGATPWTT